jgi:hypothetical protein
VLSFSHKNEGIYYLEGDPTPHILKKLDAGTYLDDFLKMVHGDENVILPMSDVFFSTKETLEIQSYANENK